MTVLELRQEQAATLIAHAVEEAPNECCGLLVGRSGRVERIYRGINIDHSPKTYEMDPQQVLDATRDYEAAGLELIGIYHSHTFTEAYPSTSDVAKAYYPDALYVIVSLANPQAPMIRAYRLIRPDPASTSKDLREHGKIDEESVIVR